MLGKKKKNKYQNNSGIILNGEMKVAPYKCEHLPLYMMGIQVMFIVLTSIFAWLCFTMTFELSVENVSFVIRAFFEGVLTYSVVYIYREKRKIWPFFALIFIYALLILLFREYISYGINDVLRKYVTKINEYYNGDFTVSKVSASILETKHIFSIFSSFVTEFMIIILSWIVCCYMSKYLYLFATIPCVVACFFVGEVPSKFPFIAYLCVTIALFGASAISNNYCSRSKMNKGNNKCIRQKNYKDFAAVKVGIIFFVVSIMFFAIFNACVNEEKLTKSKEAIDRKEVMQETVNDIENIGYLIFTGQESERLKGLDDSASLLAGLKNKITGNTKFSGGLGMGKLSSGRSKIEFNGKAQLNISLSKTPGTDVYLRGFVADSYDKGWTSNRLNYQPYNCNYRNILSELESANGDNTSNRAVNIKESFMFYKVNKIYDNKVNSLLPYRIMDNRQEYMENNGIILDKVNDYVWTNGESKDNGVLKDSVNFPSEVWNISYQASTDDILSNWAQIYDKDAKVRNSSLPEDTPFEDLPAQLKEAVEDVMKECGIGKKSVRGDLADEQEVQKIKDCIEKIKNYFAKKYTYSLKTESTSGTEPIAYFLKESKKGYCMYFASAATAMFKYAGIRCRYVEGYVVTDSDNKGEQLDNYLSNNIIKRKKQSDGSEDEERRSIDIYKKDIKDTNAHAWVEIFVNGIGWLPVEVTVAPTRSGENDFVRDLSSSINNASNNENKKDNNENNTPKENEQAKEVTEEEKEKIDNKDSEEKEDENKNANEQQDINKTTDDNENNDNKMASIVIKIICIVVVIGVVVSIGLLFVFKKRNVKRQRIQSSKREYINYVINMCNYIMKKNNVSYNTECEYEEFAQVIFEEYNIKFETIMEYLHIILKDNFAKDDIAKEEIQCIDMFYNELEKVYISRVNFIQRWFFKKILKIV